MYMMTIFDSYNFSDIEKKFWGQFNLQPPPLIPISDVVLIRESKLNKMGKKIATQSNVSVPK